MFTVLQASQTELLREIVFAIKSCGFLIASPIIDICVYKHMSSGMKSLFFSLARLLGEERITYSMPWGHNWMVRAASKAVDAV